METLSRETRSVIAKDMSLARAADRPLIWIVDDSPSQLSFTEHTLGDRYRYEQFLEGTSLIERLAQTTVFPNLVLLDWVMPGLSGDEVCRYLRSQPKTRELPIIILTASRTVTDDIVCALASGANDYVTKPFVPAELHARVGTILRAEREYHRVVSINAFAASMLEAEAVERVLEVMSRWLVDAVVDGCQVSLVDGTGTRQRSSHRSEEAAAALESGERCVTELVPIRSIATARVTLTRDAANGELDARDLMMIETCLEYSALALEAALRSERERKTTRFHEEMVGIVGHDLRGPLAAFGLGIELLREEETDAPTLDTLMRLQRSTARMGKIVELMLDVTRARIGSGIPVVLDRVGLRGLVDDVIDEVRLARPGTQFELRGVETEGNWDADRLEQVVANLVGNAVQYGRPGSPITLEVTASPGSAHFVIHNENRDGPIPREQLEQLFDPFERGRTATGVEGLGLGLYIVDQIVRAHGGTIAVASDDTGTTFSLTLPT